jgi:hypothetical protein
MPDDRMRGYRWHEWAIVVLAILAVVLLVWILVAVATGSGHGS